MSKRGAPRIREIPESERPREKLTERGASSLTDAELLAIFLRTGTRDHSAIEVAREALAARGGLHALARASVRDLMNSAKGIGPAKAAELAAAFEVGRRLARGEQKRPKVDAPKVIYEMLAPEMWGLDRERLYVLLVNTKHQLIWMEVVSVDERFGADIVVTKNLALDENGELYLEAFTTLMGHEGDNSISLKYDLETGQVVRTAAKKPTSDGQPAADGEAKPD